MSITGKTTPFQTLKRLDTPQQKSAGVGYKNVAFAHQATVGQTGIDLTSLNGPSGFNNPSASDLLNCNLGFFQNNLILMSSSKGVLMPTISFTTAGSQRINFVGFTADQDEIFYGLIMATPRTGLLAVDARSIGVTGSLIVGATDFNVGTLFQVNYNSTQQVGQVMVYRNGQQQFRCIGNNSANEGDYTELDLGNGYGQVIRFKIAVALPDSDNIMVVSNGLIAEKPDASQLAEVERVAGQLERLIPYVAQSAGVDESDLRQYSPTNIDLKSFGDIVLGLLSMSVPIETDWVAYTPTISAGFGTSTNISFFWKRVGDNMFIKGTFTAGTVAATLASFTIPATFAIDTTKISIQNTSGNAGPKCGSWLENTANPQRTDAVTATGTSTTLIYAGGPQTSTPLVPVTGSAGFATGQVVSIEANVPIATWTSNQTVRSFLQGLGLSV